jgi:enoyl-CoA hydratase/carnithine racemase
MKQILGGIARGDLDSAGAARLVQQCTQSRDLQEGLAAQREKRAPRFTGE